VSGEHDNPYSHGSVARHRSELWAMLAPGAPQLAAELAYRDAIVDHAGEGVLAAMAWAAMTSAALAGCSINEIIEIGTKVVPPMSRCGEAIWWANKMRRDVQNVLDAWERMRKELSVNEPWDAGLNLGASVLALIYSNGDFGTAVSSVASMALSDYEGNAGCVGALAGAMRGKSALPARWSDPIGGSMSPGWGVEGVDYPANTADFVSTAVAITERVLAARASGVTISDVATTAAPPAPEAPVASASPAAVDLETTPPAVSSGTSALLAELSALEPVAEPVAPPVEAVPETPVAPAVVDPELETAEGKSELETDPAPPTANPSAATEEGATPTADSATGVAEPAVATTPEVDPLIAFEAAAAPVIMPAGTVERTLPVDGNALTSLQKLSASRSVHRMGGLVVEIDFGKSGASAIGTAAQTILATIINPGKEELNVEALFSAPDGWQVAVPGAQGPQQRIEPGKFAKLGYVVRPNPGTQVHAVNPMQLVVTPASGAPIAIPFSLMGGQVWHWVGPFKNTAEDGFSKAFEPEDRPGLDRDYLSRSGGIIKWQVRAVRSIFPPVEELFGAVPGVAYLRCRLVASEAGNGRILLATNDGYRLWVNGTEVARDHSHRPFEPSLAQDAGLPVTFKAGVNEVTLKVVACNNPSRLMFLPAPPAGTSKLEILGPIAGE
jgi:hypothetical protein